MNQPFIESSVVSIELLVVVTGAVTWQQRSHSSSLRVLSDVQNATVKTTITNVADIYTLFLVLAECVPAGLASVFVSLWCEKHGNGIPGVVSLMRAALLDVGTVASVLFLKTPLFVNVLLGLVCGAIGGIVCVTAAVQSNASKSTVEDMTTEKFLFVMTALLVRTDGQSVFTFGLASIAMRAAQRAFGEGR